MEISQILLPKKSYIVLYIVFYKLYAVVLSLANQTDKQTNFTLFCITDMKGSGFLRELLCDLLQIWTIYNYVAAAESLNVQSHKLKALSVWL